MIALAGERLTLPSNAMRPFMVSPVFMPIQKGLPCTVLKFFNSRFKGEKRIATGGVTEKSRSAISLLLSSMTSAPNVQGLLGGSLLAGFAGVGEGLTAGLAGGGIPGAPIEPFCSRQAASTDF